MSSAVKHDSKKNIRMLNKVGLPFDIRYHILFCECNIKASDILLDTLTKETTWSLLIIPIKWKG
jgi:hypothetical protein